MKLSQFILGNLSPILQQWEDFARSLETGRTMSIEALRNDAERMLRFVAADMETEQSRREEIAKSTGRGPLLPEGQTSAAEEHGIARAAERFSLVELVSEYRALRASVTRMWLDAAPVTPDTVAQLVRFNEAIDQILAEGVLRFTERLDRDADLFIASVGHDISSPVNTIGLSARTLEASRGLTATDRAAVDRVLRAADRVSAMLVDLRDFARARLGGLMVVHRTPCDVGEILRGAVDEAAAGHRNRRIDVACTGELLALVDPKRIGQLVANLVGNALQHSTPDTEVNVSARGEEDVVVVEVHNRGECIPADRLRGIFDPLIRGTADADDTHLGLGLYIVRQIAIAHGGTIEVASSGESGTRFTATLPRADGGG